MNSNILSIERMKLLAQFHTPYIRLHLIGTVIFVILCYALAIHGTILLNELRPSGAFYYSIGIGSATLPFFAGALVFAMCRRRNVITTLPASDFEKTVFPLIYTFVITPLVMAATWYTSIGVGSLFLEQSVPELNILSHLNSIEHYDDSEAMSQLMSLSEVSSIFSSMLAVLFALCLISLSKRNRMAIGIIGLFGPKILYIISCFIVGIFVGLRAVKNGFDSNQIGNEANNITTSILNGIIEYAHWYIAALILLIVIFLFAYIRIVKTRQD